MAVDSQSSSASTPWPALLPLGHHAGKPPIPLNRNVTLVGSRSNAHLHLLSRSVSKAHALIVVCESGAYIRDLASRTHTLVNNEPIREIDLRDGDLLQIGSFTFRFSAGAVLRRPGRIAAHVPAVLDTDDGQQYVIRERTLLIGRRPTSDLPLLQESVSTAHAVIFAMDGRWFLRDLGSRTGTFVNDANVRKAELAPGDVIRIGETELRFGLATAEMLAPEEAADAAALAGLAPGLPGGEREEASQPPAPPALEQAVAEPAEPLPPTGWHRPLPVVRPPLVQETAPQQVVPQPPSDEVNLEAEEPQRLGEVPSQGERMSATGTYADIDAAVRAAQPLPMPEPSLDELDEHEVPEEVAAADTALAATPPASPAEPTVPVEVQEPAAVEVPLERREQEPLPPIPVEVEEPPPPVPLVAALPPEPASPAEPLALEPLAEQMPPEPAPVEPAAVAEPEPIDLAPIDEPLPPLALSVEEPSLAASQEPQPPPPPSPPLPEGRVEEPAPGPRPSRPATWGEWIRAVEPAALATAAAAAPGPAGEAQRPAQPPPPVEPRVSPLKFDEPPPEPLPFALETPAEELVLSPEDAAASIMEELRKVEEQAERELVFSLDEEPPAPPMALVAEPPPAPALDLESGDREAARQPVLSLEEPAPLEMEAPVQLPAQEPVPALEPPAAEAPAATGGVAPALEPTAEVIEATVPLPESAQSLEAALDAPPTEPAASPPAAPDFDTVAREMSSLDGGLAGPPVEEPSPEVQARQTTQAEPQVPQPAGIPEPVGQPPQVTTAPEPTEQQTQAIAQQTIEPPPEEFDSVIDQTLLQQALDELSQAQREPPPVEQPPAPPEPQPPAAQPAAETAAAPPEPPEQEPSEPPYDEAALEEALAALSAPSPGPESETQPSAVAAQTPAAEPTPQAVPPQPQAQDQAASPGAAPSEFDKLMEDLFGWAATPKVTRPARGVSAPGPAPQFVPMPAPASAAAAAPPPAQCPVPETPPAASVSPEVEKPAQQSPAGNADRQIPPPEPATVAEPVAEAPQPSRVAPRPPPAAAPPAAAGVTFSGEQASFLGGVPLNLRPAAGPRGGRGQRGGRGPATDYAQREVDVFSEMPIAGPEVEKELGEITSDIDDALLSSELGMAGGQSPFADAAPPTVRPSGPQGGTMTVAPGVTDAAVQPPAEPWPDQAQRGEARSASREAPRPAAVGAAGWTPSRAAAPPPRTRSRLVLLVVLMLLCMIAAGLAVLYYFRPTITVTGRMHFDRLGMLDALARRAFQNEQELRLGNEARKAAAAQIRNNGLSPGFLADVSQFNARRRVEWTRADPVQPRGTMTFTFVGQDSDDPQRVQALLQALYALEDNQAYLRKAQETRHRIAELERQQTSAEASAKLLGEQVRAERAALDADPNDAQIRALREEVARLEQTWLAAMNQRQALQAELDQLQRAAVAAPGTMPAADNDAQLAAMLKQLEQLNTRLAGSRGTADETAARARRALDASIEEFHRSLETAQAVLKDSPALAAYVAAAQRLHEGTRKLAGDLIQRQQKLQEELAGYKQQLDEQMEVRRREMWEQDPELKNLQQMLELKTREYNAAVASHLDKESQQRKAEIDEIGQQIRARRLSLGEDKFYTKAIQDIQHIIAGLERQLADDRKQTEAMMAGLEKELAATSPQVEKLPDEQKALAARLAEKVSAMNAARRAYAQAVAAQDGSGTVAAELESQIRVLEGQIEARKRELAAAAAGRLTQEQQQKRIAAIQQKRTQMEAARQQESAAQAAHREKQQALTAAMARGEGSRAQREKFEELVRQHDAAEKELKRLVSELNEAKASYAAAVEPLAPESVSFTRHEGRRAIYAGGAVVVVAVVFGVLILVLVPPGSRQQSAAVEQTEELELEEPADPFGPDEPQQPPLSNEPGRSARV